MNNDDGKIGSNNDKKSFTVSRTSGNNNSDGTWTVPRKFNSDPTPVESTSSLPRTRRDSSRIPNIAFVLDLLEKATAHGTLTNAEAFSAFDRWLSDRTTPPPDVVDSSCASRPSSDPIPDDTTSLHSMGLWNTNSVTTTVSAGDRIFSRSVSSTAVPERTSVSDPTLNWREQSVCDRSRRPSRSSLLKGLSRLFAACGTQMATSPPARELPMPPVSLRRGISFERPLPKVPAGVNNSHSHNSLSGIPIASSTAHNTEPIYAEYDAEYGRFTAGDFSPLPPTAEDADTDSIYDEADETFLEESYDTLKSTSSLPFNVTEIEGLPKDVHRLDSGMGSSHSDIA